MRLRSCCVLLSVKDRIDPRTALIVVISSIDLKESYENVGTIGSECECERCKLPSQPKLDYN